MTRTYDDGCGIAHALDLVGERWALLVVRELLLGPKRFTDLRAGLPGVSANILSQRLREARGRRDRRADDAATPGRRRRLRADSSRRRARTRRPRPRRVGRPLPHPAPRRPPRRRLGDPVARRAATPTPTRPPPTSCDSASTGSPSRLHDGRVDVSRGSAELPRRRHHDHAPARSTRSSPATARSPTSSPPARRPSRATTSLPPASPRTSSSRRSRYTYRSAGWNPRRRVQRPGGGVLGLDLQERAPGTPLRPLVERPQGQVPPQPAATSSLRDDEARQRDPVLRERGPHDPDQSRGIRRREVDGGRPAEHAAGQPEARVVGLAPRRRWRAAGPWSRTTPRATRRPGRSATATRTGPAAVRTAPRGGLEPVELPHQHVGPGHHLVVAQREQVVQASRRRAAHAHDRRLPLVRRRAPRPGRASP